MSNPLFADDLLRTDALSVVVIKGISIFVFRKKKRIFKVVFLKQKFQNPVVLW